MFNINDTIAAISSGGKINQAISIIRVCGSDAVKIVQKIFTGKVGKNSTITYGYIIDNLANNEKIDEVLISWFLGKNNFVGEDTVEINCHGGVVITHRILELILANGARLATPGEFTRRSFLNGKMSLRKAEAINDLIHASTVRQAEFAFKNFDSITIKLIDELIDKLAYTIGEIEVNIDYPEYLDIENVIDERLIKRVKNYLEKIEKIVEASESSRFIFDGIKVAILGKPNVGKSSILNALVGEEKAIVTDIAGTTRDIIETQYQYKGFLFKLIDTAGMRDSEELIEKIGINRSIEQINKADIIVHVKDYAQDDNEYDKLITETAQKYCKPILLVKNKKDQTNKIDQNSISISALNNDVLDLKEALAKVFENINLEDQYYLGNARQLSLIKAAKSNLLDALNSLNEGYYYDLVIVDLRAAWSNLVDINGRADNELLLDEMFKNFCLGK
ncbi:tRNA uridine-5-carboxymethylaminomethyl(34) synthesis GTPase MnmE [Mycoplasmopsis opalescens]|uniref:tRNA uridine-5-carboxymethylaminomethyl(34) synthesis GTPase MnmE n=1 Tax=Mycoplasmopsis opalescens TaxID=114886 RepID=UPI0004A7755C|nr:tRNA uridine-5-carboxymethylaminomethyl(34) synthesis GTPase MnmE [Mycoplasmopsis opalescens]